MQGFEPVAPVPPAVERATTVAPPIEPFVPKTEDLAALAPLAPAPIAVLEAAIAVGPEPAPPPSRPPAPAARSPQAPAAAPAPPPPSPPERAPIMPPRQSPLSAAALRPPEVQQTGAPRPAMQQAAAPRPVARPPAAPAVKAVAPAAIPAVDRAGREHLPRNRRLYRRVKLDAKMEVGGVPCDLIDVSVGGFAATGVPSVAANALVPVSLRLVIDGIEVGTRLNARIIYANQARSSGRFIDPSASQTAFLRYLVTWRGESVGAVGATTLLDAISGGADRAAAGEALDRLGAAPKERWWAGLVARKVAPPR